MKHKAFILIIFFIVSLFMSVTTNTLESAYKNIAEMNVLQNKNSISFEILGAKSISGTNFITALDAGDDIIIQKNGLILGPYYGKAIYLKSGHSLQVPLISGRFVTSQDMGQGQKVAVIGKNLEYLTFMENDQEYIRYDDEDYNVIGKLGHSNRSSSFDDLFILNLDQLLLKSDNLQYYSDLWTIYNLNSSTEESFYHLNNQIKNINNQTSLTQLNTQTSNSYLEELLTNRLFSLSITGVIIILLLMNILNTTNFYIESKRREIGIRKAVGASNWNISVKILKDYISLAIVAYLIAQIVYIGVVRFKITPLIFGDSINLFSTTAGFVLVLVVGCLVAVVPVVQSIRLQPNEIIKGG
ncbi:ABC transporter permease [Paenibacillus sp. L3-i20]|uniref:ABC transporter permease n=1 Tax=Paenibacillus sp. L3-i20 TaxID=2905833 RepID=UPI001EE04BC0|nr:ABC transporter permease [Paenibacillus sp. L3-i20]GKU77288.1 hypothetical protein L3i20_v216850 [Paenibacillus sp. L3-i20]